MKQPKNAEHLTPRQQRIQQVRAGRYMPLADMEPIDVPPPQVLARLLPDMPVDLRERHYVNCQLEHRANELLKRLQGPLGLAQWFGTLGRRGIKAFEAFTIRQPNDRRNWDGSIGWSLVTAIDAAVNAAPSEKRDWVIDKTIESLQRRDPSKWGTNPGNLKQQYYRLQPDSAYQARRKGKKTKNVAT